MTQIKIFKTTIDDKINKWLADQKDAKIIDIKLASSGDGSEPYTMIIYEV